ncbi:MAG: hypothetical protein ACI88C_002620, partial [Acidimicrobiales bacterium]
RTCAADGWAAQVVRHRGCNVTSGETVATEQHLVAVSLQKGHILAEYP